jgi:hypothetical protein
MSSSDKRKYRTLTGSGSGSGFPSNSVASDGIPEREPDLAHATGCKQPSLKKIEL